MPLAFLYTGLMLGMLLAPYIRAVAQKRVIAQSSETVILDAPNIHGDLGVRGRHIAVKQAGVTPRVLMIGAHPDDEDTRLLAWLARGGRAKAAYLSLTRGDGGQNLIGNELGEKLGVIRSQELLAARRVDGASQYFSRAYDFGFSKSADETFRHWNRDSLLSDMVRVVRAFQPHIIVSVFSGTERDGHGHHQVAGLLSREVIKAASDSATYPASEYGALWDVKKLYRSAWFAPERATLSFDVGEFSDEHGRSYAEIAAISRSQHRSQGFGAIQQKGVIMDHLTREYSSVNAATPATEEQSLFDGLDTARVFSARDSLEMQVAQENLALEVFAEHCRVAIGDSLDIDVSLYRNGVLDTSLSGKRRVQSSALSSPYWLACPRNGDLFCRSSESISDDEREKMAWYHLEGLLDGRVTLRAPVQYRYQDPVRGDVRYPLEIVPLYSLTVADNRQVIKASVPVSRNVEVTLQSFGRNTSPESEGGSKDVQIRLELPNGLTATPSVHTVQVVPTTGSGDGTLYRVSFTLTGTLSSGEYTIQAVATEGGNEYRDGFTTVQYDHIVPQNLYSRAELKLTSVDLASLPIALTGKSIGYIRGVGDNVAETLRQLDISVEILDPSQLHKTDLSVYPTIIVGTRAYQIYDDLVNNNGILLAYAEAGGNLVVQYGQYEMLGAGIMPFPITLSRPASRVTEENSPVSVIDSNSMFLQSPNAIKSTDFDGWVQERSLYMPTSAAPEYRTVISIADSGETPNENSIITLQLGKGRYTYTTLAFFRQIPAGVPGAIRLFLNLISPNN